jgi:hypothetical protein
MGDRADHGSGPSDSLWRELVDGIAIVVAALGPLAPAPSADGEQGQRAPTLPTVGS